MAKQRYPKDILGVAYSPGRKLAELFLKIENTPKAIVGVLNEVSSHHIKVLSSFQSETQDGEMCWTLFTDFTDADLPHTKITKILKGLDFVHEATALKSEFKGLVMDEFHFPLLSLGERCITLRVETMGVMFERLRELFGERAHNALYEMGLRAGEIKILKVRRKYGVGGLMALEIAMKERMLKGWGIAKIKKFDKKRARCVIEVQELFECLHWAKIGRRTKSDFFRGYLCGLLTQVFNRNVMVVERKCIAKGDLYCRFEIGPAVV